MSGRFEDAVEQYTTANMADDALDELAAEAAGALARYIDALQEDDPLALTPREVASAVVLVLTHMSVDSTVAVHGLPE